MPIYEFFCTDCNTLYNFFSSRIDTERRPDCPKCERKELERRPARFATLTKGLGGSTDDADDDPLGHLDDDALDRAMMGMADELEKLGDSEDPRAFAHVLRKMGGASGLEMGPKMEELLGRLESGADMDDLEAEMESMDDDGDSFDDFFQLKKKVAAMRAKRPRVDDELYFL